MRFYVNIDHVATVRQARRADEPDPLDAARCAEAAGADGITAHLREDRRHVQDADLERLATGITTVLNFELAVHPSVVDLACRLRPFAATLVPERREEVTTEGGLDLRAPSFALRSAIARLREAGVQVSLFIDPTRSAIDAALDLGVPAIELHTGAYAHAWPAGDAALAMLRDAADHAASRGLHVHAGHGLTYRNVAPVAAILAVEELNIGHSIVARALMVGMTDAVRDMRSRIDAARRRAAAGTD